MPSGSAGFSPKELQKNFNTKHEPDVESLSEIQEAYRAEKARRAKQAKETGSQDNAIPKSVRSPSIIVLRRFAL